MKSCDAMGCTAAISDARQRRHAIYCSSECQHRVAAARNMSTYRTKQAELLTSLRADNTQLHALCKKQQAELKLLRSRIEEEEKRKQGVAF